MKSVKIRCSLLCLSVCLICLLSCVSKPEEVVTDEPIVEVKEEPKVTKTEKQPEIVEPEITEPEPFTTVRFVNQLKDTLMTDSTEDALLLFEDIPEEYKDDYDLNMLQASLLISAGETEEAKALTDKLMASDTDNLELLNMKVLIAKAEGDKATKTELLKEIIQKDPDNSDANLELANEQMTKKQYKLAKAYYLRSYESDNTNLDALFGYGLASYYEDDTKTARKTFKEIIAKDERNSMAWGYLAKLEGDNSNWKEAETYMEKALSLDDTYYDFWVSYGTYLRYVGKGAEAEAAWTHAVEMEPEYFLAYIYRASFYEDNNMFEKALNDYKKIVQVNPNYYYAFESVGMLSWREGNTDEVRKAFSKAYEYNKENISYPLMIAASYLKDKNTKGCKDYLAKIMKPMDKDSIEYSIVRLYYDGINPSAVDRKISKLTSRTLRGKLTFYMGLFYELYGDDVMAKKYYIDVQNLQAPLFFEYRMNEWALAEISLGIE